MQTKNITLFYKLTLKFTLFLFILSCFYGCGRRNSDNLSPSSDNKLAINIYRLEAGKPYDTEGNLVGTITFEDSASGLLITPNLRKIQPGVHGFHVHNNPSCDAGQKDGESVLGLAAGDHYDPNDSKQHLGPYGSGHLGDMPTLEVDDKGDINKTLLAPRLKVADLKSKAVIIHASGDNYADAPAALGGGGARQYCGVVN